MSERGKDRLYQLLPAVYRQRDVEQGGPLKALLAVMEQELLAVEGDIAHLYDNWFIETCDPWVVPYIGDLLGVRFRHGATGISLRPYVANTLTHRRHKGTAAVLEQLARDVTGWPARAVEAFKLLVTSQHLDHLRRDLPATLDLRDPAALELVGGPFERAAHAADLRGVRLGRGRYNIPDVALFVWRIHSYPVEGAEARPARGMPPGHFRLHPLDLDAPLFYPPVPEEALDAPTGEAHVPAPIRPGLFAQDPRAFAASLRLEGVDPSEIRGADLTDWEHATPGVAVDVRTGRVLFVGRPAPATLRATYHHGFSADIGGGVYPRALSDMAEAALLDRAQGKPEELLDTAIFDVEGGVDSLERALRDAAASPRLRRVIRILDSALYALRAPLRLALPQGASVALEAASGRRPALIGDLCAVAPPEGAASLTLGGLWIDGGVSVEGAGDLSLDIRHATIAGAAAPCSISAPERAGALTVTIDRSIVGRLRLPSAGCALRLQDSIVDAALGAPPEAGAPAPAIRGPGAGGAAGEAGAPGPTTTIERCTVLGAVHVRELSLASVVIFTAPVTVERRQVGCVRYSYLPPGSATPRRFRCQPDLALTAFAEAQRREPSDAELAALHARLVPRFSSARLGDPAYAQLGVRCAGELRTGAEDGTEMGAFNLLRQPQREANLRASLDEHLRFGSEIGIFYVT